MPTPAPDVKMEISVLVQPLKSGILSSTNFQFDTTFRGVLLQSNLGAEPTRLLRERGNSALGLTPEQKKTLHIFEGPPCSQAIYVPGEPD